MTLQDAIEASRTRPGIALQFLRRSMAVDPGDQESRRAFNGTLTTVFTDSRRAFAEGRLIDAAHASAIVADNGEPRAPLRSDLETVLNRLLHHALEVLREGDVATARRETTHALLIDPGFGPALAARAFLERGHGDATTGLRLTLRSLRADPQSRHGGTHLDTAVERAGEALLEALRERRVEEAKTVLLLLLQADDPFAGRVGPLLGGTDRRELEREILTWLGLRSREKRDYAKALDRFLQASALRIDADGLEREAEARQYLVLENLKAALRCHCSAYANNRSAHARSRNVFRQLDALMVQGLQVENIDHWTRTQHWGSLIGWRALVDYVETVGYNPYDRPSPPLPALPLPAEPAADGGRRLFDCCTFFNEAEILEIRLRELYDVVDGFVVVEATHTHAGEPKPLVFQDHRERFRPYLDKLVYVVDDEVVDGFSWQREAHQRDHILTGLADCRDDDMILVSDVDEILRRDVAARLRAVDPASDAVFTAEMDLFFYRLDYRFQRDWRSAGAAPYRVVRRIGTNAVRYLARMEAGPLIRDAGWHFSWMGDADRFIAKLSAYAHQEHAAEYRAEAERNIEEMRRFLKEGGPPPACGPGNGLGEYEVLPVDGNYPILVREERERFARMGWIAPLRDAPLQGAT